jgi:hypothetical protein
MLIILAPHDDVLIRTPKRVLCPLPPSWVLGMFIQIVCPLEYGTIPITLPVDAPSPPTAAYMDAVHLAVQPQAGIYIPFILDQLSKNEEYLQHMVGFDAVFYSGAPLSQETGDIFATFTHVQPVMGQTETGSFGLKPGDRREWQFYQFLPSTGLHFVPFHGDLFESVIVKHKDPKLSDNQLIFFVFPELEEYHTHDVWAKHPKNEGWWKYEGRTDDFVKLRSMTKFNASHIEKLLLQDSRIIGAVAGGDGQKVPFLLLETDDEVEIDALWRKIQEATKDLATEIRVRKDMVIFTTPEKSMQRGFKGTIKRRATLEDYTNEIEDMYREANGTF